MEILGGCGEVEGRLERFYMTGEWKEYESDCDSLKSKNLINKCKMGFSLGEEEDCEKETDIKKKEACEKRNKGKKNLKGVKGKKKAADKIDCNKYMKKFDKVQREWIEKANKDCSKESGSDKKNACDTDRNKVINA